MPTFRQRVFSLAPWAVKEWLVAAEARRLNCYRRYGDPGPIREAYAFSRYEALSPEELRAWQLQRLQEVVDAARRRSPFYAGRVPEAVRSLDDLAGIPLLTKAEVREHTDDILARGLPRGAVLRDATSGSTGSPLHFYVPKEGVRVRFAIIDSYLAHLGCPYGQRRMRFGGQWLIPQSRTRPSFWVYNRVDNQLHVALPSGRAHDPLLPAKDQRLPSPLHHGGRARALPHRAVRVRAWRAGVHAPRCAHRLGATASGTPRDHRARLWGAMLRHLRPARDELGGSAQCSEHRYHVLQLSCIMEVVDEGGRPLPRGQAGRVVLTDLTQRDFPFIRYDTGDVGVLSPEACRCGWHSNVLEALEGRDEDLLITSQGRPVGCLVRISWAARNVLESQIVQTAPDHVVIRVVPMAGFAPSDVRGMVAVAHDLLGEEMRVDWEVVAAIPRLPSGKFPHLVREFAP